MKIRSDNKPPFCACGCGESVSWNKYKKRWNIYINHHCMCGRTYKHSKTAIENNRQAQLQHFKDHPERAQQHSLAMVKHYNDHPDAKLTISKSVTKHFINNSIARSKCAWNKGLTKETSVSVLKNANAQVKARESIEVREQMSKAATLSGNKEDVKKKRSKKQKELWKDVSYKERQLLLQHKGRLSTPNKPETIILNLLNELYPNEWKYTGDFSFMINGKNPDFVNCNGQKKCIELFGDYWHKGEDPQDRINLFKVFGFDTLIIWESELKNINKVKINIKEFHCK